jgi:3-oxoacyl-[acyl-carrier protein] reductase
MRGDLFSVAGKVALVTGAGPNNGHAIACALAGAGAVVAVSDLSPEHSRSGANAVVAAGGRAMDVPFDITDLEAVRAGGRIPGRRPGDVASLDRP